MKMYKKILIGLLCLIALPFVIAIFIPRSYTVSVSEKINRPGKEVFDYVRILANQEEYSEWVLADPDLHPEITGTDGTVGAIQRWNSKLESVGEGEQQITAMTPERIEVEIRFKRPFAGVARAANIFRQLAENETEVISEFHGNSPYPMNLLSYTFGRKMIGEMELKSLQNIKRILEAKSDNNN
jgi:hypothetical protein